MLRPWSLDISGTTMSGGTMGTETKYTTALRTKNGVCMNSQPGYRANLQTAHWASAEISIKRKEINTDAFETWTKWDTPTTRANERNRMCIELHDHTLKITG